MILTWDIIRRIIEILWLINVGLAIWTVFRSHRDIASTWAWLLILSILPYIGFILYLFTDRQRWIGFVQHRFGNRGCWYFTHGGTTTVYSKGW